jgi:hypothetical protein
MISVNRIYGTRSRLSTGKMHLFPESTIFLPNPLTLLDCP